MTDREQFVDPTTHPERFVPRRPGDIAEVWPYRRVWDRKGREIASGFSYAGIWIDEHTVQVYGRFQHE